MITKEELQFDIEGLKRLQEKRLENIKIFEKAIEDEEAAIAHEAEIIAVLEADLRGADKG